jgi:hypothetical protein
MLRYVKIQTLWQHDIYATCFPVLYMVSVNLDSQYTVIYRFSSHLAPLCLVFLSKYLLSSTFAISVPVVQMHYLQFLARSQYTQDAVCDVGVHTKC